MTSQRFTDALSGADGTQALRLRYDVPPVYPDATVPVAAVRPVAVRVVTVRIPAIDPRVAAAVAERAVVRPPTRPRSPAPVPNRTQTVRPAPSSPTRAQAARAGYFQGPVPTAIGPAAPTRHRSFPASPSVSLQGAADRFRSQLGQFGTGNVRSRPAMPSSPQAGPRSSQPPAAVQAGRRSVSPAAILTPTEVSQRSGWSRGTMVRTGLFLLLLVLIFTGLGTQIIDAVVQLIRR